MLSFGNSQNDKSAAHTEPLPEESIADVLAGREGTRWIPHIAGTVQLVQFDTAAELRDELASQLFQAVVGLSRLPLTSVESPLPQFSLGLFGYFFRSATAADDGGEPARN